MTVQCLTRTQSSYTGTLRTAGFENVRLSTDQFCIFGRCFSFFSQWINFLQSTIHPPRESERIVYANLASGESATVVAAGSVLTSSGFGQPHCRRSVDRVRRAAEQ